ncbi:hypothetical protein VIGAN_05059000 [Vigna angularis var. angularis]|uniref:Uncharacterized protein n=1 Tax=Vigna angularis var. angularis TaxID=157739 RepID=A0A0S3S331_PHAAN|nr:hypothetical protein VIGAN_05059000 [Vigna angularis var. angularis]
MHLITTLGVVLRAQPSAPKTKLSLSLVLSSNLPRLTPSSLLGIDVTTWLSHGYYILSPFPLRKIKMKGKVYVSLHNNIRF